jgi:hypothetical protein
MGISRRQFVCGLAGVAALGAAASREPAVVDQGIIERRVYAHGSVLPPLEVLQRHGIHPVSMKRQQDGTAYSIWFASAEARVKAWDRFNVDEEWCAVRDAGTVALQEVQVYPAGKIFEISL